MPIEVYYSSFTWRESVVRQHLSFSPDNHIQSAVRLQHQTETGIRKKIGK